MKRHYFLLLFAFFIFQFCGYVKDSKSGEKTRYSKWRKELAHSQINLLHDGALLVRLHSRKKSIDHLIKNGHTDLAEKYRNHQLKKNEKIVTEFEESFDFCPVYYFYSHDSRHIKNKHFDSLNFINSEMKEDPSISLKEQTFLTAEFGNIQQDTVKTFDGYYYHRGKNGIERRKKYQGRPNMSFGALIIKSDQFVQLRRPFPYYVRNFDSLPIKRKTSACVKKMNRNLIDFYKRVNN